MLCGAPLVTVSSCAVDPLTGRRTLQLLPDDQLNQMGAQAYQQVLSENQGAVLPPSSPEAQLVERVGRRIAPVVDRQRIENGEQPFDWQFSVIDSQEANAFALPGGKVVFYTGILPICQDENGIAVVMGHEVAHAYAGHANNRMSQQVIAEYGLGAVQQALSGGGDSMVNQLTLAALGVGTQLGMLKFGREDESEADELGLIFMARAGYDPRGAVEFWQRMSESTGGNEPPQFLSTHPNHGTRIEDIREELPRAIEEYREATAAGPSTAAPPSASAVISSEPGH